MKRTSLRSFVIAALTLTLTAAAATASTVAAGSCLHNLKSYATISEAVASVSAGSTILVCPGNYPEQLMITKALTLRGVQSANATNPTITVPSGGLTRTTTSSSGLVVYYQLLVQGVPSDTVDISGIAVDDKNNHVPNGSSNVGVYYRNTSGKVNSMAIYNQSGNGVGYAVLAENTDASPATFTVQGNSIHDFDQGGISVDGNLTATISLNEIVTSSSFTGSSAPNGIIFYAPGTVSNNRVITHPQPPPTSSNTGITVQSNALVSNNTVENFTIGIWSLGDSNNVTYNRVLLASGAIVIGGTDNDVEHNSLFNSSVANGGAAIDFNCTGTGNTVIHNVVNDAYWGIVDPHGSNTVTPNTFSNVVHITSPSC